MLKKKKKCFPPDFHCPHGGLKIQLETLQPIWPQLISMVIPNEHKQKHEMAHFRLIPTTGGKIIHASKVHGLEQAEEQEN